MNQMNTVGRRENQTTPHKTTNNKPPHLGDEITKKAEKEKKMGDFRSRIDSKPPR